MFPPFVQEHSRLNYCPSSCYTQHIPECDLILNADCALVVRAGLLCFVVRALVV